MKEPRGDVGINSGPTKGKESQGCAGLDNGEGQQEEAKAETGALCCKGVVGGKGANQAVTAGKLGASVAMVGKVGADS